MSSGGEDRRPVVDDPRRDSAADRRRRGKKAKRDLRSPSYLALRNCLGFSDQEGRCRSPSPARKPARPNRYFDDQVDRRSRSRSRSPRRRRARSNSNDDEPDRRSPSRSPIPRRRRRRARSDSYDSYGDEPARRSPSPRRRRRARSNSYSDDQEEEPFPRPSRRRNLEDEEEEELDRRSPSPRRRAAPRSCRSRSRTRSEECDDRRCCGPPANDERDMPPENEDYFYARIDRPDHLFKCARCHNLLSSPVYECVAGHVTCVTCHGSANGVDADDHTCSVPQCGVVDYGPSRAVADWLSCVRFPCNNYQSGCPAVLPWREMAAEHEPTCRYAPVFCPVRRCGFHGGPPDALERHLQARHGWDVQSFRYDETFHVRVHGPVRSAVLRAEDDGQLFHLCAERERHARGTTLSMIRIRRDGPDGGAASAAAEEFTYEVRTPAAAGMQHRMQMNSTVWATSLANGMADENPVRVTVPDDMIPLDGPEQDSVEVCVRQVAPPQAAARDN